MIGTSHDLKVGQVVYALGDPFGLDLTMTTGIVSAWARNRNRKRQTDPWRDSNQCADQSGKFRRSAAG